MKIEEKFNTTILNFEVMVYAKDIVSLGIYRNICYNINDHTSYRINLILTDKIQKAFDKIEKDKGIDIFISNHAIPELKFINMEKRFYEISPDMHIIINSDEGFKHVYRISEKFKCIEHMNIRKDKFAMDFSNFIVHLLEKMESEERGDI